MSLETLANAARAQLKERMMQAARSLEQAHANMVREVSPYLERLYRDVSAKQQDIHAVKRFIHWHVDFFAQMALLMVKQLIHTGSQHGTDTAEMLFILLMARGFDVLPPPDLVSKDLARLDGLFAQFGVLAAQNVGEALQRSVTLGNNTSQVSYEVAQALDVSRWKALAIADSEMFRAFNEVLLSNYVANPALLTGWWWHCQLTASSCGACVAMHGTIHPFTETLHDHPQGSCVALPYQAGMSVKSGPDWFAAQDEATQRAILGTNKAYDLYKSGTPLYKFVGKNHDAHYGTSVYQRSVKEIVR